VHPAAQEELVARPANLEWRELNMNFETASEETRWKIITDKAVFDQLKNKESFWCIVVLGRAINALRFAQMPLLDREHDELAGCDASAV
jgi:CDP-diacylglycerol pyrophosphatase